MNTLRAAQSSPPVPLRGSLWGRASERTRSGFGRHGHYLASHQITTLLLCSVLICSLFFPALSLYFSPDGPISAVARRGRGFMVWELEGITRQGVIWSEDTVCWDRLAQYYERRGRGKQARVVRMEQVLISSSPSSFGGALNKRTLHQTLQIQNELSRRLLADEIPGLTCIHSSDYPPTCAVSSPTNYWANESALLADADIHQTLSLPSSILSPLPLTLTNTLVGVGRDRTGTVKGAHYIAITFYLEDTSSDVVVRGVASEFEEERRDEAKKAWRRAVREVVSGNGWSEERDPMGKVGEGRGLGRRIVLKHLPHLFVHEAPRLLEDSLFVAGYIVVGCYAAWTLRGLHKVHSKSGLFFTGLVVLTASGIMSLSVCWLFGLGVALVPWKLIPFLVLVCGVDNMFVLTNAIHNTDISLPVPARVAAGLGSVGVAMTANLAVELVIARVLLNFVDVQVIRELIIFASVAVVVDYCLEMTFFTTILSIDIQRLELADLLQKTTSARRSSVIHSSQPDTPLPKIKGFASFWLATRKIIRARAARTSTFAFLFLINVLLYSAYGPDHYLPAFCSETALAKERPLLGPSLAAEFASSLTRGRSDSGQPLRRDAAQDFWKLINPANTSSVHVYIEPISVVKFYDDELAAPESAADTIVDTPAYVKIGIVVAPIGLATLMVYCILLYLLKDTSLLEAERQQSIDAAAGRKKEKGKPAAVEMAILRGRHAADVELLASSDSVVVSWGGLDTQIVLWKRQAGSSTCDPSHLAIPIATDSPSLIHLAIDHESRFCAAATSTGRILVWEIERRLLIDFSTQLPLDSLVSPSFGYGSATHLIPAPAPTRDSSAPPGTTTTPTPAGFFSVHSDGAIVYWNCVAYQTIVVLPASASHPHSSKSTARSKSFLITSPAGAFSPWPIIARVSSVGALSLHRCGSGIATDSWTSIFECSVASSAESVSALAVGSFVIGITENTMREVVVLGMADGSIAVFDVKEGKQVCELESMDGPIRQLRLLPAVPTKCTTCAERILDGFIVLASTVDTLKITRIFAPPSSTCVCTSVPTRGRNLGSAGSSESVHRSTSLRIGTPRKGGQDDSLCPSPRASSYSRRGSREMRRAEVVDRGGAELSSGASYESLTLPPSKLSQRSACDGPNGSVETVGATEIKMSTESLSSWSPVDVRTESMALLDDRGGWEVVSGAVVGLRRRNITQREKEFRREGESRGRIWEVFSVTLDGSGGGNIEGATPLESLSQSQSVEQEQDSTQIIPASANGTPDSLRRRILKSNTLTSTPPLDIPLALLSPTPTIRLEDVALPFSRARPIVLGGTSVVVGLGNTIAVISPENASVNRRNSL